MSVISCPHCGAQYDRAQIGDLAEFQCGACSEVVTVPQVRAARPVVRPAASPPAAASSGRSRSTRGASRSARSASSRAAPDRRASRSDGRRRGGRDADEEPQGPNKALLFGGIGGGVLLLAGLGFALSGSGGDDPPAAEPLTDTATGATTDGTEESGPQELSPAAWKALSEGERKSRATAKLAAVDPSDSTAVRAALEFFRARDDEDSVQLLAKRHLEKVPDSAVAREMLGVRDMRPEIEKAIRECEVAYMADAPEFVKLRDLLAQRAKGGGAFVPDVAEVKEIEQLIADLREADKKLGDPYHAGASHWVKYQQAIEVMREYPAVHELTGPYLIFAQIDVPEGTKMADVPKEKVEAAKKTLAKNVVVFNALYEGWMKHIAPMLGLERYGPENSDQQTLLKANIFPNEKAYIAYNLEVGGPAGSARAYYSLQEPRFICSYVGGEDENEFESNQVQCHEATHQLVHFYTWDNTRKKTGRELEWLQCRTRYLWSIEGFAEFFSSHKVENGACKWMQPLEGRMQNIWIFDEIIALKDWAPWRLEDILRPIHGGQLQLAAESRGKLPEDRGKAIGVFSNQFYAKAWSLVYYLWYAEKDGKPRYRDQLGEFMKLEFLAELEPHGTTKRRSKSDFRRVFGLEDDGAFATFEKEWRAFELAMIDKHKKPEWNKERDRIYEIFKIPKPK